ncbi:hypothetical protein SAMN05428944_0623 [Streptomyces sp. 1222.5]|uniref:hypothetical protein n=1 Tax=unclassified Streptomyces TaxID=2593676 RepID=UPI00089A5CA3|nr:MULTISPECIES: hypothetical protein [unclassified Streptomyces]PKW12136.1 hypothetical protein BX260_7471 [Streptomyces sp. 5112.2]SEB61979.1 hypothetical protein SAMN05428944_0623 [Streptomyces sp. 1222.5]
MHTTTTTAARTVRLLTAVALSAVTTAAVTGCGGDRHDGPPNDHPDRSATRPEVRARQVADAWDGSPAAAKWRTGYYPMADAIRLPDGGLRGAADRRAYETGNFDLRGALPSAPRPDGEVRWRNGDTLGMPILSAQEVYTTLDRDGGPGPRLTVTAAKPGETTVVTSRGRATVPAWLFTVKGYDTPLRVAAVSPSPLPQAPIRPLGPEPTDELTPLGAVVDVAPDGRSVTVRATHGSCDDGPVVKTLETAHSVVLSASVAGARDGICPSNLLIERVRLTLKSPVGGRALLDAFTGRPLTHSQ